MNFFDKRPLSLILCIILGSFVFFSFGDKTAKLIVLSCAIALLLLSLFLTEQRSKLILCSVMIILSSLVSYFYFNAWFFADKRYEERCEIEGVVENVDFDSGIKTLYLKCNSINHSPLSSYKLKVILDDEDVSNISVTTRVKFTAELDSFRETADFNEAAYYYSRGYNATAESVENLQICGNESFSFEYRINEYRKTLSRNMVINSSAENGGLLAALLLGEREFISGQTRLDFSRIGISHILALSGMHVAILCYGLSRLLSLLWLNKKLRSLFEIIFALGYMTLTGFPVSVVRAGVMLIISSALFLLSSTKDSCTNLFLAVAVIIFIKPYAVFDISLWLSVFATLGIIICAEIFESKSAGSHNIIKGFIYSIFIALSSTVFAVAATMAITHFEFRTVSSFSLVSTIVFSPIILIFMYIGTFFLFTCSFLKIGGIINFYGDFIRSFAHLFSKQKHALLSTDFILTEVLVIVASILLLLFIVIKTDRKKTAAVTVACLLISSIASAGVFTAIERNTFEFSYNETDSRERILIKANSDSALIEISTLSSKVSRETIAYLKENHITYLKDYVITSYNVSSVAALNSLLSNVFIKNVYIPQPKTDTEKVVYSDFLSLEKFYNINMSFYTEQDMLNFSEFTFFPVYYDRYERFAFTILYEDKFYTYITANMLDTAAVNHALKIMNGADTVIVGAKGDSSSSQDFLYKLDNKTNRLIFNKKTGLTAEILKYYEDRITVDPNGRIDLYVK